MKKCWVMSLAAIWSSGLLSGCQTDSLKGAEYAQVADLIIHNAQVLSLDERNQTYTAVAVHDGRILALGGAELKDAFPAARRVDAQQGTLLPGFIDSHIHISGEPEYFIDLNKVSSIAQMQDLVAAKAKTIATGGWITGYGWSEDELAEQRKPVRGDLDAVAPAHKVLLTRAGGHSAVANSAALAAVGWDRSTPDPENGSLERAATGELTGIVRERQDLILALIPKPSYADIRSSLITNLQNLFRLGITSIVEAMTDPGDYAQWQQTYTDLAGHLPRASIQLEWRGPDAMRNLNLSTGDGDEWLRVGPVKLFVDGGFTGPAAYTSQPYKNQGDYRGKLTMSEAELDKAIRDAHGDGWQLGIHAIGDAAIDLTVATLVAVLEDNPRGDHRHYLNHFTVMPTADTMQAMAEHEIAITQQPNFTYTLEGRYVTNLDGLRLETNNPLRTPMNHGIHLAISSDILPIGPAVGIHAAVNRQGMSGKVFGAQEALSPLEALRAYTIKGAYFTREEDVKGSLEVGKYADFVLLQDNPLTMDKAALINMKVRQTYLGGKLVFSADD